MTDPGAAEQLPTPRGNGRSAAIFRIFAPAPDGTAEDASGGSTADETSAATKSVMAVGGVLALGMALQTIYTGYFGPFEPTLHRGLTLGICALAAAFAAPLALRYRDGPGRRRAAAWAWDIVLVGIVVAGVVRLLAFYEDINESIIDYALHDQIVALLAMIALVILSSRYFGLPLSIFAGLSLVYIFFGRDLPWIFRHSGFDLSQVAETIWFSTQGIFGLPTGIVLDVIFIFVVFGAVLQFTGAGDALIKIALHLSRRSRAGPAHSAIIASAAFGTMSGSVTANVVGTGTITIPMVRARGFSGPFAGGIEAAASTGGQILPPVMGAAAFLMAELSGHPYVTVAIAALIPGLFFYLSLFVFASLEARRLGIAARTAESEIGLTRRDWLNSLMFLGPIAAIVYALVDGYTPTFAGFLGTVFAIAFSFLNPAVRREPSRIVTALVKGGIAGSQLMVGVAVIGIVFGALSLSGVGLQIAILLSGFAGESLFLALALAAFACLVLGMGMPTLPAYLIIVLIMGPAFTKFGVPVLAMHFFVFYFGVLSAITPPVALAAFAAAPIARAGPISTGLTAMKLSVVGFVVPFVIVYEPSILLVVDFEAGTALYACARLAFAIWLLSTALIGFEITRLPLWQRIARLAVGLAILSTVAEIQFAAIAAAAVLIAGPAARRLLGSSKRQPHRHAAGNQQPGGLS